jgi:hypothetical protein
MPDTHSEHGSKPEEPELVTIPEMPDRLVAAGIKPVGLTRLRQLALTPEFPPPVYERGNVRVWDWPAVERYFRHRVLRPGERTDLKSKREQEAGGAAAGAAE